MPLVPAPYARVLRRPGMRLLLTGYGVSLLGDGLSVVSVAALALRIGDGPHRSLIVGGAVAAYSLPAVLGALVLRRWLVHVASRRLIGIDCVARASALGAIPIVRACGALSPAIYIALLAAGSLLMSWGFAGRYAMVSELTDANSRLAANSVMTSLDSLAVILGPALGGAVIAFADPSVLIAFDALSYVVLGLVVGRLGVGAEQAQPPAGQRDATGWAFLRGHPQLLALLLLSMLFFFLYGPVEVALPVFVADHHPTSYLGLYWAVFGLGALTGGLIVGALRRLPLWRTAIVVVLGWGTSLTVFGITPALLPTLLAFGVGGLIYGPYPALSFTLFQNETPPGRLTSVLAARSAVLVASAPLGTALGGPLTAAVGARTTLLISGLATIVLALVASPLIRRDRRAPVAAAASP